MKNEKQRKNHVFVCIPSKEKLAFHWQFVVMTVNKNLKVPKHFVSPHIIEGIDNKHYYKKT
jgi:hypothetical protein